MIENSHDQYREAKQTDEAVIDLATRSFSPEVQKLIVQLLNEANKYVLEAHQTCLEPQDPTKLILKIPLSPLRYVTEDLPSESGRHSS